jgi:hypothetical protein
MSPVVAIYGCFERWNISASDKNDMSPVSPLVRSREWAKSEFNVGHSRVAVQTRNADHGAYSGQLTALRMNSSHCVVDDRNPQERISVSATQVLIEFPAG